MLSPPTDMVRIWGSFFFKLRNAHFFRGNNFCDLSRGSHEAKKLITKENLGALFGVLAYCIDLYLLVKVVLTPFLSFFNMYFLAF